jgi:hypothetical protein
MSPSLPFTNVTVVGRRAGAEPQRSAAPDRRPIDGNRGGTPLSTERAPARSARRAAQPDPEETSLALINAGAALSCSGVWARATASVRPWRPQLVVQRSCKVLCARSTRPLAWLELAQMMCDVRSV